jgi:hypothetical protein
MTVIGIVMPIPGLKKFIIDYINLETLPKAISTSPITFLYRDDATASYHQPLQFLQNV